MAGREVGMKFGQQVACSTSSSKKSSRIVVVASMEVCYVFYEEVFLDAMDTVISNWL
jgi:hypothetical protein